MLGINKVLAMIRKQVGLRTDAASVTGSLHAKMNNAFPTSRLNAIDGIVQWADYKPFQKTGSIARPASDTTYDVLSITGKGFIDYAYKVFNKDGINPEIIVTIDGTQIVNAGGELASGLIPASFISSKEDDAESEYVNVRVLSLVELRWESAYVNVSQATDSDFFDPRIVSGLTGGSLGYGGGVIVLQRPIFFKTSLLVQIRHHQNATAADAKYAIGGGIL